MTPPSKLPEISSVKDTIAVIGSKYPLLDPDTLEERTLARTLNARTAEEALFGPESVPLDEITGQPFYFGGIQGFMPSTLKGNEGDLFAFFDCQWDDGRSFTATTGSLFSIVRAHRLVELEVCPIRVMSLLVQSKSDPNRSSLWLVPAPLRADNGSRPIVDTQTVDSL